MPRPAALASAAAREARLADACLARHQRDPGRPSAGAASNSSERAQLLVATDEGLARDGAADHVGSLPQRS
jgi:hypothetical protein